MVNFLKNILKNLKIFQKKVMKKIIMNPDFLAKIKLGQFIWSIF